MTIIILLICVSLAIAVLFLGLFLWSMKSGQYDDTYTPSVRILFDSPGDGKVKKEGPKKLDAVTGCEGA